MESVFATLQVNALINLIPDTNKSRKAPRPLHRQHLVAKRAHS